MTKMDFVLFAGSLAHMNALSILNILSGDLIFPHHRSNCCVNRCVNLLKEVRFIASISVREQT